MNYAEIRNRLSKSHIRDEHALRCISVFKTNGFNIAGRQFENGSEGLFIDASRFNHCCISNLDRAFDGSSIEIRAIRSIEEGDELCLSYLDPTRLAKPPTITTVLPVQLLIHNSTRIFQFRHQIWFNCIVFLL